MLAVLAGGTSCVVVFFLNQPCWTMVAASLKRKSPFCTLAAEAESQQRVAGVRFHISHDEGKKELTELTDKTMVDDCIKDKSKRIHEEKLQMYGKASFFLIH